MELDEVCPPVVEVVRDHDRVWHFLIGDPFPFISPFADLVEGDDGTVIGEEAMFCDGTEEVAVDTAEEVELIEADLPADWRGCGYEVLIGREDADEVAGLELSFEVRVDFATREGLVDVIAADGYPLDSGRVVREGDERIVGRVGKDSHGVGSIGKDGGWSPQGTSWQR